MFRYVSLAALTVAALRSPRCANIVVGAATAYSVLWLAAQFVPQASRLLRKVNIILIGATHFLLSRDKAWPKQADPGLIVGEVVCTKRIIFVRHGESKWNEVFNKGFGPKFFLRFVKAILSEIRLLPTLDSVFYDSPLNKEGVEQARRLFEFLQVPPKDHYSEDIALLRGEGVPSVIASSNLRRCLQTATVGLWDRLSKTRERILMLSCLQEIARNVDTVSMAAARAIPELPELRKMYSRSGFDPLDYFDPVLNAGNKTLDSNGLIRMLQFLEWAFQRPEAAIIVSGHSLWFKNFFNTFLPYTFTHDCKKRKLVNAGAVAFNLQAVRTSDGSIKYRIDQSSLVTVFGGYC